MKESVFNIKKECDNDLRIKRQFSHRWHLYSNYDSGLFRSKVDTTLNRFLSRFKINLDDQIINQTIKDVTDHISEDQQKVLWFEINNFIDEEQLQFTDEERQHAILKAMSTYVTSHLHYGPLVTEWAKSLLDTAVAEKRKLIFLARDGLAPYLVAGQLKTAYTPQYHDVDLSLIYISRTVAYSATLKDDKISSSDSIVCDYLQTVKQRDPHLLRKYILQETGLSQNDRCIFVDVGFSGSVIYPITSQLEDLGIDMQFSYLISHTTTRKVKDAKYMAKGFLADNEQRPMSVVEKAGGNPAVHWIEDTHQWVIDSPKVLTVNEAGRIVPAKVHAKDKSFHVQELLGKNPQTCKHKPEEYLIKTFGLKGVLSAVRTDVQQMAQPPVAWMTASEERRASFAAFLHKLHSNQRALLIKH